MLVVSSNDFRTNQKKYLDPALKEEQICIKRGKNTFIVSSVKNDGRIKYNPEWVEAMKQSQKDFEEGNVTVLDNTEEMLIRIHTALGHYQDK